LVIPSFGQAVDSQHHQFVKLEQSSIDYPIEDCFAKVKKIDNNFELCDLEEGKYKFVYGSDIDFALFLTVLPGKRWKYSSAYIDSKENLSKMLGDMNYMTLENSSFDGNTKKLKLKIRGN
jgi:hypothetical protein